MDVPKPLDQVAAEASKRVAVVDPDKGLMLDRRRAQRESRERGS